MVKSISIFKINFLKFSIFWFNFLLHELDKKIMIGQIQASSSLNRTSTKDPLMVSDTFFTSIDQ